MSYNGTVRCSYCYNTGHNRRSCPELKKFIEENPDSWRAVQAKQAKERASNRKCGWCGQKGHNARTCPHKKEVYSEGIKLLKKVNKAYALLAAQRGVGKGTLVSRRSSYGNGKPLNYLVLGTSVDNPNATPGIEEKPTLYNMFRTWGEPRMTIMCASTGDKTGREWLPSTDTEADKEVIDKLEKLCEGDSTSTYWQSQYNGWGYNQYTLKASSPVPHPNHINEKDRNFDKPNYYGWGTGDKKRIDYEAWHTFLDKLIEEIS